MGSSNRHSALTVLCLVVLAALVACSGAGTGSGATEPPASPTSQAAAPSPSADEPSQAPTQEATQEAADPLADRPTAPPAQAVDAGTVAGGVSAQAGGTGSAEVTFVLSGATTSAEVSWIPAGPEDTFQGRYFGVSEDASRMFGNTEEFTGVFELPLPGVLSIKTHGTWSVTPQD